MRIVAFLLFVAVCAFAAGFYGNQSDIKWKSASTEHFRFIYPAEYTGHASKVSAYAEAVYDSIVNRYRIDLPSKVNATLSNALYSNGSAIPSENTVNLWLTNWDFKIRSSHGWISDVITHEFSHLVSIENASKFTPSLYGFQVSYADYYNERTTTDFLTMYPFTLQPLWLAEGTAQYESSRMGFDSWDTHRDMLLRIAALNDSILPLPYMHDFSDNSLLAELGPYTQGFSLVQYISAHYGDNALPKIWSELSRFHRLTLSATLERVIGISEQELYDNWKLETTEKYKQQLNSLGTLVEGVKITKDAFWQDYPVVAGNNVYGVSNFGGLYFDGSVFKLPFASDSLEKVEVLADTAKGEIGDVSFEGIVIESDETDTLNISDYAKSGFKAKNPWFDKGIDVYENIETGPILAYVSYKNRDKSGHAHFDIALSDTNKNEIFVTYLADAVYPAINKQGTEVAFAMREPFSTRFRLAKVPFPKDFSDYIAEEPIDIFVPNQKYDYYNIYSPKFSPNGKRIAFGFFDNVTRGIAIVDANGKNFKIVSDSLFDERDVNWIDDDNIIFASNRNGIFNLFEKNLSTETEYALTNVRGGAFTPVLARDTIYFTEYDKDGFSLYKIAYNKIPMVNDTLVNVTMRDSILQKLDTLWSKCEEIPLDSFAADSICTPVATITMRDSTITLADTMRTIRQIPGKAPITLNGTLLQHKKNAITLPEAEFAGKERDYKPIPTTLLFVPMLVFSENAPDLTVFGNGKLKTKAGLALIASDPLKKNTVQLGLLLELGEGFKYINGDGLNPRQEKEFFASWQNKSTPIDLSLSYTYANYTSKDTIRYEDVRAHNGDSLGINRYAIPMQSIVGALGYSIFKSIDTLQVAVGYDWSNFDLYQDDFEWTYQKKLRALVSLGLYSDNDETGISGEGNGLMLYYQYSNADLYRPGTFSESFTVTSSGTIKPNYRNFNINEVGLNMYGSVQSPLTGARLAAGAKFGGIFNWSTDAKEDTLDSYYYSPIFLEGYPYLRSSENYTRSGMRTAVAELHYLYPIYDDFRHGAWIFETRSFYVDLFTQVGAAWNGKFLDFDKFTEHGFWDRSVGITLRMSNKIFYNIPFDITLSFARALDRIGEEDSPNGKRITPIDVPILPQKVSPTRIKFAIGMGFINSWM